MLKMSFKPLAGAALLALAGFAQAATVTVLPSDSDWATDGNRDGGSSAITGTQAHMGNGSIEMTGDRTRFTKAPADLGLLNDVLSLTFDWSIAVGSVAALHPDYTPALRLQIVDGNTLSELIWEGAYNGTYGNTTQGQWYSSGATDVFHRWVTGSGQTFDGGGAQVNLTLSDWASNAGPGGQWYSDAARVYGISVGVGSSAGGGFRAFADNISFTTTAGNTSYNFEVTASAVPEPAALALVGLALGVAGLVRRRRAA